MRLTMLFGLFAAFSSAQDTTGKGRHSNSSIQMEAGLFGDFFYTGLNPGQMEHLTGIKLPAWGKPTQPRYGDGVSNSIHAGYYTFTYQKLLPSTKNIWWAAGLSFQPRNLAESFFSADTVYSAAMHNTVISGDSLYTDKIWYGSAGLWGLQLNFPVGIRIMHPDITRRFLSIGINLSPGFTFNHTYYESYSISSGTAVATQPYPHFTSYKSSSPETVLHHSTSRLPGMFFNVYAGLPFQCNFNPAGRWQFMLALEPGYMVTFLERSSPGTSFMLRMGMGVKRLL